MTYESFTARTAGDAGRRAEVDEQVKALHAERATLETVSDLELAELGLLYADRPGYLEEWRP